MKRRKLTDKEKKDIDEAINRKVKKMVPPKQQSCDYHAGVCEVACNADPIGTAGCPPCPPIGSGGDALC